MDQLQAYIGPMARARWEVIGHHYSPAYKHMARMYFYQNKSWCQDEKTCSGRYRVAIRPDDVTVDSRPVEM